jgi:hypothetical protein
MESGYHPQDRRTFSPGRSSKRSIERHAVRLARISISLFGAAAVMAATLAGATIWLLLTDPVTVADAVQSGDVSPIVRALATSLYDAMRGLLKYL